MPLMILGAHADLIKAALNGNEGPSTVRSRRVGGQLFNDADQRMTLTDCV